MRHRIPTSQRVTRTTSRRAFTLVEMLVAVTLVLLMMTMFAAIFQMATNSVSVQRGIAQNDQRTRSLTTILRSDLQKRTFRYVQPFYPGEDSATSPTPFGNRAGYLYISPNDPFSGLDDLIQFTVDANLLTENLDDTPYYGKAALLVDRRTDAPGAAATGLDISPNQPDADDGTLDPNGVGVSPKAEVSIFVRNGTLYRRVTLIREPLAVAGLDFTPQPTSRSGYDFFSGQPDTTDASTYDGAFEVAGTGLSNDFHLFFDYAAIPTFSSAGNQSAKFIGIGALSNELVSSGAATEALGNPVYRFGFNPFTGLSREHTTAPGGLFLGRFLHSETSAANFNWPQNICVAEGDPEAAVPLSPPPWSSGAGLQGNPYDITDTTLTLNADNGLVTQFDGSTAGEGRGGPRRVEDVLLANVHEMRVEIWDDRLQKFVIPGHVDLNPLTGEAGDYHAIRNLNPAWGPLAAASGGRVFDTGHPAPTIDSDGDGLPLEPRPNPNPPYIAYTFYPPHMSDSPPGPSPNAMPLPVPPTGTAVTYWTPGTYNVGDVVFARQFGLDAIPGWDFDGDGVFEWDDDASAIPGQAFQMAYRCIAADDAGGNNNGQNDSGATIPVFPARPGRRITDGELVWESFDNRRPLQSIRLTIRFMDQTTDSMRQLTLLLPVTDEQ